MPHCVCTHLTALVHLIKTTRALFYLKFVTDHVMLACLTSESSVFHEQHVCEMCHMSLRHWQTFSAFSFILFPSIQSIQSQI
jgi:hypothetical protein